MCQMLANGIMSTFMIMLDRSRHGSAHKKYTVQIHLVMYRTVMTCISSSSLRNGVTYQTPWKSWPTSGNITAPSSYIHHVPSSHW